MLVRGWLTTTISSNLKGYRVQSLPLSGEYEAQCDWRRRFCNLLPNGIDTKVVVLPLNGMLNFTLVDIALWVVWERDEREGKGMRGGEGEMGRGRGRGRERERWIGRR